MLLELDEGTSLVIEAEDGMCLVGSAGTFVVEGMPPAMAVVTDMPAPSVVEA